MDKAVLERSVTASVAVMLALFHIWANTLGNIATQVQNGIHFAGFILLATLQVLENFDRSRVEKALILGSGMLISTSAIFLIFAENAIYERGVRLSLWDWGAALIVMIGAIEWTRRTTGWIIPILILLGLSYIGVWGAYVDGVFAFRGLSFESIVFRSIYGDDAIFGTLARISSTFIFMFILFGAFLHVSGATGFIINLAHILSRRFIGAPGFVAVIASSLTGTISGSAVANTVSTGVITIPLMKRAGFKPSVAGGIEAAASTGGQLMPPIMGAGAFVMASITLIPYGHIVAMSVLPAVLYFATVGFFVRIQAKRLRLSNIHEEEISEETPSLSQAIKNGGLAFIIPISVLITLLVIGYTPTYAAGFATVTCIVSSWFSPQPMGLLKIIKGLQLGARNMVITAILLCSVGLIINVIVTAGLGNTFSLMIATWANGNLLIAILLIAIASLILGMGLPVTASYIVLSTLSAPALYQLLLQNELIDILVRGELQQASQTVLQSLAPHLSSFDLAQPLTYGTAKNIVASFSPDLLNLLVEIEINQSILLAALLSAHMIIFWLSQDSNVTPPVCLAAFTAAQIARAPPMQTGISAWKHAKGLYLIPILFAYTPFLHGDWLTMMSIFIFAIPGLWALCAAIEGFAEGPLLMWQRFAYALFGVALLWPASWIVHLAILLVFILFVIYSSRLWTRLVKA